MTEKSESSTAWNEFASLAEALSHPGAFPHPVKDIERIDTHISLVILTGDFAYKIKRPVHFDFADFSTLALRHAACLKEIELNKRTAPDIYLDVVSINRDATGLRVQGDGPVVEYAVRMRQFCNRNRLDQVLSRGELDYSISVSLARDIACFHQGIEQLGEADGLQSIQVFAQALSENFDLLQTRCLELGLDKDSLQLVHEHSLAALGAALPLMKARAATGQLRDCHGDLHLENLILDRGVVRAFDCVEFNDAFRRVDTLNDLAFLLMDLESRGAAAHASLILNVYLEHSGDFAGVPLIDLFKSYRALVRAKVAALGLLSPGTDDQRRQALTDAMHRYLHSAGAYAAHRPRAGLVICSGLSGAGKSWLARRIGAALGGIIVRSDVERKRLYPREDAPQLRYSAKATRHTYEHLAKLSHTLLVAGRLVIADATCLKRWQRQLLQRCAQDAGLPSIHLQAYAPESTLRERIRARGAAGNDASEADIAVLESQLRDLQDHTDEPQLTYISVDTARPIDWVGIFGGLDAMLQEDFDRGAATPD